MVNKQVSDQLRKLAQTDQAILRAFLSLNGQLKKGFSLPAKKKSELKPTHRQN